MARRFQLRFTFGFALFCVYYILTNFALGRERPPVNHSKRFFLLIFRQSSPSFVNVAFILSRQFRLAIVAAGYASLSPVLMARCVLLSKTIGRRKVETPRPKNSADSRCAPQQKNHPNHKRKLLLEVLQHANRRAPTISPLANGSRNS